MMGGDGVPCALELVEDDMEADLLDMTVGEQDGETELLDIAVADGGNDPYPDGLEASVDKVVGTLEEGALEEAEWQIEIIDETVQLETVNVDVIVVYLGLHPPPGL